MGGRLGGGGDYIKAPPVHLRTVPYLHKGMLFADWQQWLGRVTALTCLLYTTRYQSITTL